MSSIPQIAWVSGFTASLIFMIIGWPLANLLFQFRFIYSNFFVKIALAAVIGIVSAPLAERHAPIVGQGIDALVAGTRNLPDYMDRLNLPFG